MCLLLIFYLPNYNISFIKAENMSMLFNNTSQHLDPCLEYNKHSTNIDEWNEKSNNNHPIILPDNSLYTFFCLAYNKHSKILMSKMGKVIIIILLSYLISLYMPFFISIYKNKRK